MMLTSSHLCCQLLMQKRMKMRKKRVKLHNFAIKDAYNALNTIKSVFLKKGGLSDDVVKSITKLDCALDVITHTGGKQTTINDFFSNK
uniref:Translationally controlled tumor protein n=1 Tax=Pararge aegeria TaxID=116150 RepID=S4NHN7_9NEOP